MRGECTSSEPLALAALKQRRRLFLISWQQEVPLTFPKSRAGFTRPFLVARPHIMLRTILTLVRRQVPITDPNLPIRLLCLLEEEQVPRGVKKLTAPQF